MAHDCVDWSVRPPVRKTPLVVLTRGNEHVYTAVPKDLQTLASIARREFDLGDVDVHFTSSCVDLCHGRPARITEHAWEHLSPLIGCATVEVSRTRQDPLTPPGHENEREQAVAPSDHENERRGVSAPEDADDEDEEESLPRSRRRSAASEREQSADHQPSQPIKQEKHDPRADPSEDAQTQTQTPPDSPEKLLIRVAHRASQQEAKFTTKGTTRVAKVLAGACRSFGLDPSQATLYLVIPIEFEAGQAENLFPCGKNDTIVQAGAEHDRESQFVLKMAEDP